jgi:hypothetical protein
MQGLTHFLLIMIGVLTVGILYQGFTDSDSPDRGLNPIKVLGTLVIIGLCVFAKLR